MGGLRPILGRRIRATAAAAAVLALAAGPARAGGPDTLFDLGPENIGGPGSYGEGVDHLNRVILWIVVVTFVLTEGLLLAFLVRYRARPGAKAVYTHGNHRLEVIWTLVPGAILVFLAFYQFGTWREIKVTRPPPSEGLVVQVMGKQFEWHLRYAGPDGRFNTSDDVFSQDALHVPAGVNVTVQLRTQDVLHSFFLPYLRLKQDTVPGMTINQWFRVDPAKTTAAARKRLREGLEADPGGSAQRMKADLRKEIADRLLSEKRPPSDLEAEFTRALGESPAEDRVKAWIDAQAKRFDYEIACAELCGLGHTKMRGILIVETEAEFFRWLDGKYTGEVVGFDSSDKLINRFWPSSQNKIEDSWLRDRWPADLKANWPKEPK